jgi:hypothetical protein
MWFCTVSAGEALQEEDVVNANVEHELGHERVNEQWRGKVRHLSEITIVD